MRWLETAFFIRRGNLIETTSFQSSGFSNKLKSAFLVSTLACLRSKNKNFEELKRRTLTGDVGFAVSVSIEKKLFQKRLKKLRG